MNSGKKVCKVKPYLVYKKCVCCNEYCLINLCEACEEALAAVTDEEIGENIENPISKRLKRK